MGRKYDSTTAKEKLRILEYADKFGFRAAGKQYSVAESNIRYWKRQEAKLKLMPSGKRADRGRTAENPEMEEDLTKWVSERRDQGLTVSSTETPNQRSPEGVNLVNRTPTANTSESIRQTPDSTPPINPMKCRLNAATSNGDMSQKICIKSEDGGIVAILPLGGTGGKENEKNPNEIQVVGLPEDMDETAEDDVKPNVEVLSQMINNSNNNEQMKRKSSQGQSRQASEQANTSAKDRELLSQLTNEVIQLTSTLGATTNKLATTTNKLESLQQNICKLLKIILPDVDLGDSENIGEIVSELIRVNAGQT
ncbi:hypothetical protein ScPMuIL_012545 [Solemya velum]